MPSVSHFMVLGALEMILTAWKLAGDPGPKKNIRESPLMH